MIMATARSSKPPSRFLSNSSSLCVLNGLARIYGFEAKELLKEDGAQRALWNLLSSISHYGIGTPQRLKAPVSVVWSLSYRCNLRCVHCYQNASQPSPDELALDEQLNIVDQLARIGVSMVVLSGGEPLTNPNLYSLIRRIRMHKMAVSIDSNGVLMNSAFVSHLKELGVSSVELSLDSVHAEAHDRFRGLNGVFQKTLDAIELCSQAGIFTTVATTATTLNHDGSQELISLARERGASRVVFFDLVPAGRGKDVQMLSLSQHQLLDLMALVTHQTARNTGEVFIELPQYVIYSSIWNGESISDHPGKALSVERFTVSSFFDCAGRNNLYRNLAAYLGGCPAGRLYCNIQPNGDVTPCMFMPTYPVAGNLRKQSFEEIWNSPVLEALRDRKRLTGKCRECEFVTVCGGCRAKAAAYQGDYLASDPTCPIQAADA
jgi:radical SAM protein with 4Fe4S-binding SPASM domain